MTVDVPHLSHRKPLVLNAKQGKCDSDRTKVQNLGVCACAGISRSRDRPCSLSFQSAAYAFRAAASDFQLAALVFQAAAYLMTKSVHFLHALCEERDGLLILQQILFLTIAELRQGKMTNFFYQYV